MSQLEQQRVLRAFSAGVYNVLVATSVGEEVRELRRVHLCVVFVS